MSQRITVRSSRVPPKSSAAPGAAARPGQQDDLVDCLFDNSDVFMDQLQGSSACHSRRASSNLRRPGPTIRRCARPLPPTAMPRFSASVFEAPVARRSSGSRRRSKRMAFHRSPSTRNDLRGSATGAALHGYAAPASAYTPHQSSIGRPRSACLHRRHRPDLRGARSCSARRPHGPARGADLRVCRSSGPHLGCSSRYR
jgi:hypothetical protein